jgi:predicted metal-binding transcription factor (methanogenesis marker protein 9)
MNLIRALEALHFDTCEEYLYVKRRFAEETSKGEIAETLFKKRVMMQAMWDGLWKINFPKICNLSASEILAVVRNVENELTDEIVMAAEGIAETGELNSTDAMMRQVAALRIAGKAKLVKQLRCIIKHAE